MELNKGYKNSRLLTVPHEWSIQPLSKVSFMKGRIGWQGLKQTEFTTNHDEPFLITGVNFKDGEIRWDEAYHVSEERYELAKEIQLKSGDVLMTKDGTIGKLLYVSDIPFPHKATLNSHLLVFRPIRKSFIPKYLYYQLDYKYFKKHIELTKSGTTFFGLSQESVGKFHIPLPPIPEQNAIAEVLSDTDKLIQSLEKQIAKKHLIKKGVMQRLLAPKEDWEKKQIGELAEVVGGGTPSTTNSNYWNGKINWFTPTEIGDTKYVRKSLRKLTREGLKQSSAQLLPIGTILLTSRAGIGDISITMEEASTNQGFQSLIVNEGVHNEFLYYLMLTKKEVLLQYASGSTFLEISPRMVRQIAVFVPSYNNQMKIATTLSNMDNEIESLVRKLNKYKTLKKGLMQNLLTGKIRLV